VSRSTSHRRLVTLTLAIAGVLIVPLAAEATVAKVPARTIPVTAVSIDGARIGGRPTGFFITKATEIFDLAGDNTVTFSWSVPVSPAYRALWGRRTRDNLGSTLSLYVSRPARFRTPKGDVPGTPLSVVQRRWGGKLYKNNEKNSHGSNYNLVVRRVSGPATIFVFDERKRLHGVNIVSTDWDPQAHLNCWIGCEAR